MRLERRGSERGQAAVELTLALPLLAAVALVLLQVALVFRDQLVLTHAAREAARAAAVDGDPGEARRAATDGSGLDPGRLLVSQGPRGRPGSQVTVRATYDAPTDVPVVGALVGDVRLTQTVTIRVER